MASTIRGSDDFDTAGKGTLVSGTAVTASGTSVDFTGIPSWVKRITVVITSVSTNGTSNPIIQIGDSGGLETSGYSGSAYVANSFSGSANTNGWHVTTGIGAASVLDFVCTIVKVTGTTWVFSSVGSFSAGPASHGGGAKTLSDTLTQLRITTAGGTDTFDAGTINSLYE